MYSFWWNLISCNESYFWPFFCGLVCFQKFGHFWVGWILFFKTRVSVACSRLSDSREDATEPRPLSRCPRTRLGDWNRLDWNRLGWVRSLWHENDCFHSHIACSHTLYSLFKVRRARVIKYEPQEIYWPPACKRYRLILVQIKLTFARQFNWK